MMSIPAITRRTLVLSTAVATLGVTACGDESTPPEIEPEIATVQITSGTSTVQFSPPTAAQSPGPLTLRVSQANPVTVRFLGTNGQDEAVIAAARDDFELRVTAPTGWTFTRTGGTGASFTATLTPTQTGSAAFTLSLFALDHGHNEFQRDVSVTVTQ
jgi:hypothetical protein